MFTIFATFPRIESLELYKMVEPLHLNVTDLIDKVLLYGDVELEQLDYVDYTCHKFGAVEITIKQQKEPV